MSPTMDRPGIRDPRPRIHEEEPARATGKRTALIVLGAIAAIAVAVWAWNAWWPSDERAIRQRLGALAETVNEHAPEGLGTVTRATQIGGYFTDDVAIDLGSGTPPIRSRETLIGIAARMSPRLAGHTLEFDDVTVAIDSNQGTATVNLVAIWTRSQGSSSGSGTDARELQLGMTKADGAWRIERVTALDTLRRQ